MRPLRTTFLSLGLLAALPAGARADSSVQVQFEPNSYGLGAAITAPVGKRADLRFIENGLVIYTSENTVNPIINIVAQIALFDTIKYKNYGLFYDLHWKHYYPVSYAVGVYNNLNFIDSRSIPTSSTVTIDGTTYSAAAAGTIDVQVFWRRMTPYVGLHYGLKKKARYGLVADLGAAFQGNPLSTITATGEIAANPQIVGSYLNAIRTVIAKQIAPYDVYPIVGVGFSLKI